MARFDVFHNTGPHAGTVPFLLDVQSDLLGDLDTRVVIPLSKRDKFPAIKIPHRLTPIFNIDGIDYLLETPKLAAVPLRLLKSSVHTLATDHAKITGALDFLFQGF